MPRGHYHRQSQREPQREPARVVAMAPAEVAVEVDLHVAERAVLVEVLPAPEPDVEDAIEIGPGLSVLLAEAIQAANRNGMAAYAAELNTVATTLGELRRALDGLTEIHDLPLAEALYRLATAL